MVRTLGAQTETASPRARIGIVRSAGDARVIPFADVEVVGRGIQILANSEGRFRLAASESAITIRVRRVGFKPTTLTVAPASGTDTIGVTLEELHLDLDKVRTSSIRCSVAGWSSGDTAAVSILQQARLAAERGALFADRYPYVLRVERALGNAVPGGRDRLRVRAKSIFAVDTTTLSSTPGWRYAPGEVVGPIEIDGEGREHAAMRIPQLADFAGDAFATSHCIHYTGRESVDGRQLIRVEFAPLATVRTPDVSGSLLLDPTTFQLRRSRLLIEVRARSMVWTTYVETSFRERSEGVVMIDSVKQVTLTKDAFTGQQAPKVATEDHRTLDIEFLGRRPE